MALPAFRVTNDNAPALAQVCHRLDGIPLAIELAAAKVRMLTVEQIIRRLDDRFQLLTGGSRTVLERHQTLRPAIDWSFNLISTEEQVLFRRLSVFVGGWPLEAAESVCAGGTLRGEDVFPLLEQLLNKSLIVSDLSGRETRYRMLETVRQYAREKLDDAGESLAVFGAHAAYYLDLAREGGRNTFSRGAPIWLRRLDVEMGNLRQAFNWALEGELVAQLAAIIKSSIN